LFLHSITHNKKLLFISIISETQIMIQPLALLLLLGSCSCVVVDAKRNNGAVSKAIKKFPSYQSDPLNLLRGIEGGEYDQIYIQYHRCVWSEYTDNGDNDDDPRCNAGDDAEDQPWYMGKTQCYRANIAYSLYGVRKGDDSPRNACGKRYYINSFYTKNGMEDFGNLLGLENYGEASSQCTLVEDDENGDGDEAKNDNGSSGVMYPNARSYTTACAGGKFVTAMFHGAYCTGRSDLQTINELDQLNNELEELDCALVYSAEDENKNKNGNQNKNGRRLEEGEDEDREDEDGDGDDEDQDEEEREEENEEDEKEEEENVVLWDVLAYSSTCSILEHPIACPDPYGVKKRFGLNPRTSTGFFSYFRVIDWFTSVFFVLGFFLLLLNCLIKDSEPKKKKRPKAMCFMRRCRPRSTSNSRSKNTNKNDSDSLKSSEQETAKKKKKGIFRGFFSRKK